MITVDADFETMERKTKRKQRFAESDDRPRRRTSHQRIKPPNIMAQITGAGGKWPGEGFEEGTLAWTDMHIVGTSQELKNGTLD